MADSVYQEINRITREHFNKFLEDNRSLSLEELLRAMFSSDATDTQESDDAQNG